MPARNGDVYALRLGGTPKLFRVECVVTAEARARGLSGRDPLKPGHGMLFLFDQLDTQQMWMPDMKFPLDIVWLDENLMVVHVTEYAPPCEDPTGVTCAMYSSKFRVKYAIEMTAGQAGIYGFAPGLQLSVA